MTAKKKWVNETEIRVDGKRVQQLPEYNQWRHMKERCKVGGGYQAMYATYVGCTFAQDWSSYDLWLEWARQQTGFLSRNENGSLWHLDKDILFKGNKHYSPETCVFIPQEVNKFLTNSRVTRGLLPVGVHYKDDYGKYRSSVSLENETKQLGCFTTPEAAFQAYKTAKEQLAKQLAIKYTGLVDPRVIDALNNFTVNIDD